MSADLQTHILMFLLAAVYAVILESFERRYEPDGTILTVIVGVALVGLVVAYRVTLGVPPGTAESGAWWLWGQTVTHFTAAGGAIGIWQVWQSRRRLTRLIRYLREERYGDPTDGSA